MNKWIKFLKEYKAKQADGKEQTFAAGEVIELAAAKAAVLIEMGYAEPAEDPSKDAVTEAAQQFEQKTAEIVEKAVEESFKKYAQALKVGEKSKRPHIETHDNELDDPKMGFKSFGEFAGAVQKRVIHGITEKRLDIVAKAPTNYAAEAIGADGGYLVPTEFNRELLRHMLAEDSLLSRTRRLVTAGNSITIVKDETTPWGTDGVTAKWVSEGAQIDDSKPKFGELNLTLHKLAALVPVTNEMLDDTFIGLGSYLNQVAPEKINSKVNTAIVKGSGAGQPLGYRNSGASVEQAKESGQTAATVNVTNVAKMLSRLQAGSMQNAAWLYNPTVIPQLVGMTVGQQPVWLPNNRTVESRTFGTLFGMPLVECGDCAVVGTVGDIELVDLTKYLTVTKSSGIQTAMSLHLYFDRDITTFRFVFRIAGQPWQKSAITLKDSATTQSPFVKLATRS